MKRPWNIVDMPVYSLATYQEGRVNMNICTYVTPISMKPKLYAVAVYNDTYTLENIQKNEVAVLQILSQENINLIRPLGKKSGLKYDKHAYLEKKELLITWHKRYVLKNACAWIQLRKMGAINVEGDHQLFYFKAEKYKTLSESNILMFQELIDQKIIL